MMKLYGILPFARQLLDLALSDGDIAVDGTIGNGHDTVYLAKKVGRNGHVFGFDIQQKAITNTTERIIKEDVASQVTLFQQSHADLLTYIPTTYHGKINGAIFNLGYLPGGDKTIVTTSLSTIAAIEQLLNIMAPQGIIVLVIYHGHQEGAAEKEDLLTYVSSLDQQMVHVLKYEFINQVNSPPFIIAIEKR